MLWYPFVVKCVCNIIYLFVLPNIYTKTASHFYTSFISSQNNQWKTRKILNRLYTQVREKDVNMPGPFTE